ncbi:MAG: sodium:calcium antiporter [Bdellovibrionales bacterium]
MLLLSGWFFVGLSLLVLGSHLLVRSLISLSYFFRVKPLYLSIIVLGFVTSSSEWFVTFIAAYREIPEAALSNVIGSNTINILLILSFVSLICPFKNRDPQIIKFDLPCLLSFLVFVAILSYDGFLNFIDCLFLLLTFGVYLYFLFHIQKKEGAQESPSPHKDLGLMVASRDLVLGFGCLFLGSHWMIDNAIQLSLSLGWSERFIGFLVLALGTSLPELAVCISAALKKEVEMILGNIIGSNIFNTLFVVGSAGLLTTLPVSAALYGDYLFMFLVTLSLWILLAVVKGIPRWSSFCFLVAYASYIFFFHF